MPAGVPRMARRTLMAKAKSQKTPARNSGVRHWKELADEQENPLASCPVCPVWGGKKLAALEKIQNYRWVDRGREDARSPRCLSLSSAPLSSALSDSERSPGPR